MRTLNNLTHYNWLKLMPRRMLQQTRDEIDRQWTQASQQLRNFQPALQRIDGKLHTIPHPKGERLALEAVQGLWDAGALLMERHELQGWTRVVTELCGSRPFSAYSVAIRPLIGKLEAEAAARLDKTPPHKRTGRPPDPTVAARRAAVAYCVDKNKTDLETCKYLDVVAPARPDGWLYDSYVAAYRTNPQKVHNLFNTDRNAIRKHAPTIHNSFI